MSLAVEIWRALEAWDPDRHPRGPGGRFIKLGSGGGGHHDRPSLADAVRGTAAAGPKRQRSGKGGMSVADAVRQAARRSDTTGRPTQRSAAEHRAHGAHDVADEVDRALAEARVSEDVRRQVSGRARAAAESHGPRPETLSRAGEGASAGRVEAARNAVVDAYASLQRHAGDWVPLAEIRDRVPSQHARGDVDAALEDLAMRPGVQLIPWDNRKALTRRDHDAALHFGGEENNNLRIESPGDHRTGAVAAAIKARKAAAGSEQPSASRAADADSVRQLADTLRGASSREEARAAIAGLNVRELRGLAAHVGSNPGSKATKAQIIDGIVHQTAGARLDSRALNPPRPQPLVNPPGPSPAAVQASSFDAAKAAHGKDALYAAPKRSRVISEAAATPEKRAEMQARLDKQPDDAHTRKLGGKAPSTNLGDRPGISHERAARIDRSVFDYTHRSYLDMNKALHDGNGSIPAGTPEKTRQQIEDLDELFSLVGTRQDSVLYRGTVIVGDPPDELSNPGFSSATADADIAKAFSKGYFNGAETGSARMPGTPTVYELRVPKGYPAVRLSDHPDDTTSGTGAAEVLLRRGTRARKVEDRGQVNGVRHVVYEVIPDGQ